MGKRFLDWILRFVKGMLIGTGAILPGVSGGALAAVFGIYERMISFIAHITKDFKKNFVFFLPVGLGGVFGIFLLSFALSFLIESIEVQMLWFFVGCIAGIAPALYAEAGKKGRRPAHLLTMLIATVTAVIFLYSMEGLITGSMPLNLLTWLMAGAIFALGLIIPGLSPSNFLLWLGMYKPMTDGIKTLDFAVIIPLLAGAGLTVLLLSKLFDYIFRKAYTWMFHIILGIVLASTIMIIPRGYNYLSLGAIGCVIACVLGIALGAWMTGLEKKHKRGE